VENVGVYRAAPESGGALVERGMVVRLRRVHRRRRHSTTRERAKWRFNAQRPAQFGSRMVQSL